MSMSRTDVRVPPMIEYCAFCRHHSQTKCCPWCAKDMRAWIVPLVTNLATAAFGERCFRLGREHGSWSEDPYPDWEPWAPGCGLSALHFCLDCDAPLKSTDAEQGMRTCEGCARERRESR